MTDVDMAPAAPEPVAPPFAQPSDPTTMNGGDGRKQLWPPGSEMQIFSEKLCVLLTPNMSLKAPKGYAWVPEGDRLKIGSCRKCRHVNLLPETETGNGNTNGFVMIQIYSYLYTCFQVQLAFSALMGMHY